jgi:hypothetical protein
MATIFSTFTTLIANELYNVHANETVTLNECQEETDLRIYPEVSCENACHFPVSMTVKSALYIKPL